ncbi:MAG: glycosyltransferase [Bacteroidetes bacterium]|nr:glycosyltransferase [Bacteroidota bacterium]
MKIGIAISSFGNKKSQLIKCLDSVIKQNYKSELIVCLNDGDINSDVVSKYNLNYRIFSDNLGLSANWNRAVSLLKDSDYITFVHADDTIEYNHIQVLADTIGDNDICFTASKLKEPYFKRLIYIFKNKDLSLLWKKRTFIPDVNFSVTDLINLNTLPVIALIKRETWDKLGGYSIGQIYPDWDFWIRAKKAGCKMNRCTIPTYTYTVHSYPQSKEELKKLRILMKERHKN